MRLMKVRSQRSQSRFRFILSIMGAFSRAMA